VDAAAAGATKTGESRMAWGNIAGEPHYERLRVALAHPSFEATALIKGALQDRGMLDVIPCDSAERLYRALDREIVDLLLCDYHMLNSRFVEVMQRIRRKEVGQNPFLTIIATIRDSKAETVRRLLDAGIDDLIRVPFSIDRVFESIGNSARRRRPFVVTYAYVGPLRAAAKGDRRSGDKGIKVPNTLKARAFDGVGETEVRALVERARDDMIERQLENCGIEMDRLAKRVVDSYASVEGSDRDFAMRGMVGQVAEAAHDFRHRAAGTRSEHVADLAASLIPITQRILEAPTGRAVVEVRLLSQLAAAVRVALTVEPDADPTIRAITDTVGNFARRNAPSHAFPSAA
jgi:CheY-like chemotaxis protein